MNQNYRLVVLGLLVITLSSLCGAIKVGSSNPYLELTDVFKLNLDSSVERIMRYHYFNPNQNDEKVLVSFTMDDFLKPNETYIIDRSGEPIVADGIKQTIEIEKIKDIFKYSFGPVYLNLEKRSSNYAEFHIFSNNYWDGKSFSINHRSGSIADAKFLRTEIRIPKKPQSTIKQYSLYLTKIDPAPDIVYETPNENVFVWNLGDLSFGDFFIIDMVGGYEESWFPLKDKFVAGLIGFFLGGFLTYLFIRRK